MKGFAYLACVVTILIVAGSAAAGPKWELGEDSWMKLSYLGQVHATYVDDAEPNADVFLRRSRIILAGQISDGIRFFVETDNDNAGKYGASTASTDIQDAFIDLRIAGSEHWVEAGLILLPFSFENRSSAASLLGHDYNSETIKFVNHFVWRDFGAELHGGFGDRIAYCVGAFDGYDSKTGNKNPGASLRGTGYLTLSVIGKAQTGWFYSQDRRGKSDYLSLGFGGDFQSKATLTIDDPDPEDDIEGTEVVEDSKAWVVDVQSGFGLGSIDITLNGAWYDWDNAAFKGSTAFVEAGIMAGKPLLTLKYSRQDPDGGDATCDYTAGLHYFLKGYNARCGVEYRWGDSREQLLFGLQFLL